MKTIIFDWKRTLYDPEQKQLIDGALQLLNFLKQKNIPLILIGKGSEEMHAEVERLGIKNYFNQILFHEGQKEPHMFAQFVDRQSPEETIIIGDRVHSELAIGKSLGATTIWIRQGKFASEEPENDTQRPTHILSSLSLVKDII